VTGFLQHLAGRVLEPRASLRPRLPSSFEPAARSEEALELQSGGGADNLDDREPGARSAPVLAKSRASRGEPQRSASSVEPSGGPKPQPARAAVRGALLDAEPSSGTWSTSPTDSLRAPNTQHESFLGDMTSIRPHATAAGTEASALSLAPVQPLAAFTPADAAPVPMTEGATFATEAWVAEALPRQPRPRGITLLQDEPASPHPRLSSGSDVVELANESVVRSPVARAELGVVRAALVDPVSLGVRRHAGVATEAALEPVVNITIGRVEIRSSTSTTAAPARARAPRPQLGLTDYLAQRGGKEGR
jgi:hypothetical protein